MAKVTGLNNLGAIGTDDIPIENTSFKSSLS